jgi:hypothetical protein
VVDALQIALDLPSLGVTAEALVLVRSDNVVTRILADPLLDDSPVFIPADAPEEHGDERILYVLVVPEVRMESPDAESVGKYENLRDICSNIGHPMIDMLRTDGDSVQSMSIALDPRSPWFENGPPSAAGAGGR